MTFWWKMQFPHDLDFSHGKAGFCHHFSFSVWENQSEIFWLIELTWNVLLNCLPTMLYLHMDAMCSSFSSGWALQLHCVSVDAVWSLIWLLPLPHWNFACTASACFLEGTYGPAPSPWFVTTRFLLPRNDIGPCLICQVKFNSNP